MVKKGTPDSSGKYDGLNKNLQKKKKEEAEKKESRKISNFQKEKEKIRKTVATQEELENLKEMIDDGIVSDQTLKEVEHIARDDVIDTHEMLEIMEKIDAIHENDYVKKHIPKDMLIGREEYKKALKDEKQRKKTLAKIEDILGLLAQHISPTGRGVINIFSAFALFLLDKNLVKAQEDHIDLKFGLKK